MATDSPDQVQYLRDTIDAYRRRLNRETDEEVRRYLWQRIVELECRLASQSRADERSRGRDGERPRSDGDGRGMSPRPP